MGRVTAVRPTCNAPLDSGLSSISVRGLPYLLDVLKSSERKERTVTSLHTCGTAQRSEPTPSSHLPIVTQVAVSSLSPFPPLLETTTTAFTMT